MKRFAGGKISTRLTVLYGALFFLTMTIVNLVVLISIGTHMDSIAADQLTAIHDSFPTTVDSAPALTAYDFASFIRGYDNADLRVLMDGVVIFDSGVNESLPVRSNPASLSIATLETRENTVMVASSSKTLGDGTLMQIDIVKNMDNEQDYLANLALTTVAAAIAVLFVSILIGYVMSRRALRPIDVIIDQTRLFGADDLSRRLEIRNTNDEISRLAETFNDLFARLQRAYEKQAEFTLDASHELATPLSVIKGYTDLIDRWGKDDPAILAEAIEAIKAESSHMTRLIDDLLMLAKSDRDLLHPDKRFFPLHSLTDRLVREMRLVHPDRTFTLTATPIDVYADDGLVTEMLRAVLDNAVKYSTAPDPIRISLSISGGMAEITVADHGTGIPPDDLPHVFDRFYRVDKSRSRLIAGTGLGLAIVKMIAEALDGAATIESVLGEGTTVRLLLPTEMTETF